MCISSLLCFECHVLNCNVWFFFQDILEFVDCGCTNFLSELSMAAKLYSDMFIITQSENESDSIYNGRLKDFITNLLERFVVCVKKRALLEAERSHPDFKMLVRALDRLYRRLQANKRLIIGVDLSQYDVYCNNPLI